MIIIFVYPKNIVIKRNNKMKKVGICILLILGCFFILPAVPYIIIGILLGYKLNWEK